MGHVFARGRRGGSLDKITLGITQQATYMGRKFQVEFVVEGGTSEESSEVEDHQRGKTVE